MISRFAAIICAVFIGLFPVITTAQTPLRTAQQSAEVLSWDQNQKDRFFPHMERRYTTRTVPHGRTIHALPRGPSLDSALKIEGFPDLKAYMKPENVAGLLVIKDGKVRLERYGRGLTVSGHWTSFSVAKSITSTLVGAAIADGAIQGLDDLVTTYLPDLKGSGYDGVTIRHVLTMTSGVKWNEDYSNPNSDVAQMFARPGTPNMDVTVSYMRQLPRESAPGTKWVYKTGETNLIGALVMAATHKSLSAYLSEKVWKPYGMEGDANWVIDGRGQEAGGCCLSAVLRDFGRFGQFVLDDGVIKGQRIVPEGWFAQATHKQTEIGVSGYGYGYQWWTRDDGRFEASGIFGQMIFIDPKRRLVIVKLSARPKPTGDDPGPLIKAVERALD